MFDSLLLLDYWNPLLERCGFVNLQNKIVEVQNEHPHPNLAFRMAGSNFQKGLTYATWHSHPFGSANLSTEDYQLFLNHPELRHFIVGRGIVWEFYVRNNQVFRHDENDIIRRGNAG